MAMPTPKRMEKMSQAYVMAVTAKAGVSVMFRQDDFGIDGSFKLVTKTNERVLETGIPLDFQLKSTTNWQEDENNIIYDLESKTYNDLVDRLPHTQSTPCILIVLCLPPSAPLWLSVGKEELAIRKCCYWLKLEGEPTSNRSTKRIQIPCENRFDPEALKALMDQVQKGTL